MPNIVDKNVISIYQNFLIFECYKNLVHLFYVINITGRFNHTTTSFMPAHCHNISEYMNKN